MTLKLQLNGDLENMTLKLQLKGDLENMTLKLVFFMATCGIIC